MTRCLKQVLERYQGVTLVPPTLEPAGADIAALGFEGASEILDARLSQGIEELRTRLHSSGAGILEWTSSGSARFGYFSSETTDTVLETRVTRMRHVHDLIRARSFSLEGCKVTLPKDVAELISSLPPCVLRCCRIVAGDVVLAASDVSEVSVTRKPAAKVMDTVSSRVVEAAHVIRPAAVQGSVTAARATGGLLKSAWNSLKSAVQTYFGDPAIVLGNEVVLFGWKE